MKPKISSDDSWALPKETPARKAARLRKLRAILKKGAGLKPGELSKAIRPGYYETFRAMEDPAPYGHSRLEAALVPASLIRVTTALATKLAKMTRRQKLHLADRLLAETGAHAKPDTIRSSDDPALTAELRRRLTDRSPGAWLTLDEFRAQTRPR